MNGKKALIELLNGNTMEFGKRYYRYNSQKNIIEWRDSQGEWKISAITINDFLAGQQWNRLG